MRQWREVQIADSCCGCGSVLTDLTNNEVWDGDEARCDCCGRPGSVSADEDGAHVNWHDVPDCKCWWCQAQNEIEAKDATIADLRRQVENYREDYKRIEARLKDAIARRLCCGQWKDRAEKAEAKVRSLQELVNRLRE